MLGSQCKRLQAFSQLCSSTQLQACPDPHSGTNPALGRRRRGCHVPRLRPASVTGAAAHQPSNSGRLPHFPEMIMASILWRKEMRAHSTPPVPPAIASPVNSRPLSTQRRGSPRAHRPSLLLGTHPSHFLRERTASRAPQLCCRLLLSTDPRSSAYKSKLRPPVSLGEPLSVWQPQTTSLSNAYPSQSFLERAVYTPSTSCLLPTLPPT